MERDDEDFEGILGETDEYIELSVGAIDLHTGKGLHFEEADYPVGGEIWQVHKAGACHNLWY